MKIKSYLIILSLIFANEAMAIQNKEVNDGDEFNAVISRNDLNRIKVVNDKIRDIKSNNQELDLNVDEKNGEVYLRVASAYENKPINIFILTQQNQTYKGILYPKLIPAEQIILNNENIGLANNYLNKINNKNSYEKEILELMNAMRRGQKIENYQIKRNSKYIDLGDLSMKRSEIYKGVNMTGEVYIIKNSTKQILNLDEKFFYKNGVKAIKIEKRELLPNEQSQVFIII
ncbi:MAG: type-F conjugative transfer system secretin TraK [Rickettsiales bacterium]